MTQKRQIQTLLVANRAEIARRIIRCCEQLAIRSVAIYSTPDRDLPHVREADLAVHIGEAPADRSYLDGEAVLEAARRAGADAIHPGYGFLAENAAFAQAVIDAGLIWVGPPPEAIRVMGDKARARQLAAAHDVPTVPGFDEPECSPQKLAQQAEQIGYPLLVKAAFGGGGRGMRRVDRADELAEALAGAAREAEAAFGDGALLLEKLIDNPRHVEVQVFADGQGRTLHLFERECSIQRRHQKIIEECPSPAVDDELRERLGDAAVRLTEAVGYVGAGTVEFLLDGDGRFYFLEMNTRLQVEHPVTELVTGLDLVSLQLSVAEGEPLPLPQELVAIEGHAIEARLYAEDPCRDYLPSAGSLVRFDVPHGEDLRVDAGYETGDAVSTHYDSMLAKIITWGDDRPMALRRLRRALEGAWVPGLATNLPLLREVVGHEAFAAGATDTGFLPRHGLPTAPPLNLERGALLAAVTNWAARRNACPPAAEVAAGFRLEGAAWQHDRYRSGEVEVEVGWRQAGERHLELRLSGDGEAEPARHEARAIELREGVLSCELDGILRRYRVAREPRSLGGAAGATGEDLAEGEVLYLHLGDGEAMVSLVPRFPSPLALDADEGSCLAPTPGSVVGVHVTVGEQVGRGARLVTLEAMKMEHTVVAPADGVVESVRVELGEQVDEGALLVQLSTASDDTATDEPS